MCQTQVIRRISIPMDDFGIARRLLDGLSDQPKRARKTKFSKLKQFLKFAGLITAQDTVHSIAKGLDAAGNLTVEVTLERSHAVEPRRNAADAGS